MAKKGFGARNEKLVGKKNMKRLFIEIKRDNGFYQPRR